MNATEIWRILDGFTLSQARSFIQGELKQNPDDQEDFITKAVRKWGGSREKENAKRELQAFAELFRRQKIRVNAYPHTGQNGCALIIGNSFVSDKFEERLWREPACTRDLENMGNLWGSYFGCDLLGGQVHKDQTAANMRDLVKRIANPTKKYDFVVVVISTHGGAKIDDNGIADILLGNDGHRIRVRELQSFFRNNVSTKLQDIPKIFLLQYCRGKEIDRGVLRGTEEESPCAIPSSREDTLLPAFSDTLTLYATQLSYVAFRNDREGSWLLSTVNEVFRQNAADNHVVDMLIGVNDAMKNKRGVYADDDCKAMSIFESTLTKNLYLYPRDVRDED